MVMHVEGMMYEDEYLEEMCYHAYIYGKKIDQNCYEKGEFVYKYDSYAFDYEFGVPGHVPLGDWDIYLKLNDPDGKCVGCVKGKYFVN
jgi:hypothetical protein